MKSKTTISDILFFILIFFCTLAIVGVVTYELYLEVRRWFDIFEKLFIQFIQI